MESARLATERPSVVVVRGWELIWDLCSCFLPCWLHRQLGFWGGWRKKSAPSGLSWRDLAGERDAASPKLPVLKACSPLFPLLTQEPRCPWVWAAFPRCLRSPSAAGGPGPPLVPVPVPLSPPGWCRGRQQPQAEAARPWEHRPLPTTAGKAMKQTYGPCNATGTPQGHRPQGNVARNRLRRDLKESGPQVESWVK